MKQAIKNGIDNVDFYAPTYIDKDAEVTWIKSILSPYCNSNWQIVDNQVTESYGVLMLNSNDGQLDFVRVSTNALDRQVVTDESKTGFTVKASYSNGFEWIAIGTDTIVNSSIGGGEPVG